MAACFRERGAGGVKFRHADLPHLLSEASPRRRKRRGDHWAKKESVGLWGAL